MVPYVWSYLGLNQVLPGWVFSLFASAVFTFGAYGGSQIKHCCEKLLSQIIGFNVGKQKQPHSIDEQEQQYAYAGCSLCKLLLDGLRSCVNCNTIGRCVGSWVAGPAGDIWGSIVGSCMDTFWQPPVDNNVNKKYLLDKVSQPR
ncbi:hypothetical protein [Cardinium endosymbiont of Philonthus spinipes]|uniref:hypothetical protein n=1 Tax=Cardinium endosymbiont of Philonthus spinipes TaxID=3077941 RepID=UPI00313E8853